MAIKSTLRQGWKVNLLLDKKEKLELETFTLLNPDFGTDLEESLDVEGYLGEESE